MSDAKVNLWGRCIGGVSWDQARSIGIFQYDPEFIDAGIEVAPLKMPAKERPYEFMALNKETFKGLPGMLADSLPDRFGNRLINIWLEKTGRDPETFNPVERLCYIGRRGMGALEYEPEISGSGLQSTIKISQLVELANQALTEKENLLGHLNADNDTDSLEEILRVGTSAGGARAKAVLSWNPSTNEFHSGQTYSAQGFEQWLFKFDGVSDASGSNLADTKGFGRIEYAYANMARAAGITIPDFRLHHEGGRSHFMVKRFDRDINDQKIHMQSLMAIQHFDFNDPSAYSYEQAVMTIQQLGLGMVAVEEQFRRAIFNIMARNQDDHVKNISFLMNRSGEWSLSPAYDVTYSYNPQGQWTQNHQMSLNGVRNNFSLENILQFARAIGLKKRTAMELVEQVMISVSNWDKYAEEAKIPTQAAKQIGKTLRLDILPG